MGFVTLGIDDVEVVVGARVVVGVGVLDTDDLSVEREICETEEPIENVEIDAGFSLSIEGTDEWAVVFGDAGGQGL